MIKTVEAVIDEQAMHCGYCYNGLIVKGAELLSKNPQPTDNQKIDKRRRQAVVDS